MKVTIDAGGCHDYYSYAYDGFTLILSDKAHNKAGGGGDGKGYNGLFNVLVSEFDFYYNQGDIATNSFSMHRCYNKSCWSNEDHTTSQVRLPFSYDKCKTLTVDFKFVYINGTVKIYTNGSLLMESNEDLLAKFNGYGYFGISGYFRGNKRNLKLIMKDSYYCTDKIEKITFYSIVDKVRYEERLPTNIPAGSPIEVTCRFVDLEGYPIPHFKTESLTTWEIGISYSCKTDKYNSDFFIYLDKVNMKNMVIH